MSPVLILSRLYLKRRFQFLGISEHSSWSTARTFLTVSSSITRRRPAIAAFSVGTMTVMSLCRILIVRYSRLSPSTFLRSSGPRNTGRRLLRLQVAIDEIDLLLSAKALADVLRPDLADAFDGFKL